MSQTKEQLVAQIRTISEMLKEHPLHPVGGIYNSVYQCPDGALVPAYSLPARNSSGIPFVMPDFVRHKGLQKADGFQNFSHDVHHLLENNVNENHKHIKRCWSELHKGGSKDARWREGALGDGGVLEGQTLVICAPGPSLAEDLVSVATARRDGKCKVMVINKAIPALEADYIFCMERFTPEDWRSWQAVKMQQNATIIVAPQCDYHFPAAFPKERMYWGYQNMGRFASDKRINWLATFDALASTTIASAVRVGYELGAARILLVGVDFCCPAELVPVKMPLPPQKTEEMASVLEALSADVCIGKGRHDRVKELAGMAQAFFTEREKWGWMSAWKPGNFYYNQSFESSPYQGDPRFSQWSSIRTVGGEIGVTTLEFLSYAEQLRTVCGVIESGSDCRIVNASKRSAFNWRHLPLAEALAEGEANEHAHQSA